MLLRSKNKTYKMRKILLLLYLICCLNTYIQGQAQSPPSTDALDVSKEVIGTWVNQIGSTFTVDSVNLHTGQIYGFYVSPSGTKGNQYPITGWVNYLPPNGKDNGISISFTVRWGNYGSVTSWTGLYKKGTITTLWHLVRSNADYSWSHIFTGSDIFNKKTK